jgi:hypothetical protein
MITSREVVLPSLNRAMEMCESRVYEIYKDRQGDSPVEQELHMREVRKLMREYRKVRGWIRDIS